jgi:hypothetical protein
MLTLDSYRLDRYLCLDVFIAVGELKRTFIPCSLQSSLFRLLLLLEGLIFLILILVFLLWCLAISKEVLTRF